MVYHLEVCAYSHRYGDLIENDSYYSDVFSTLKKAVAEGKWWLDRKIQDLYQESGYCTQREDSLTIEDMIKDKAIYYYFKVTSLSPYYADNFEISSSEYKCKNLRPTHIVSFFDLKGNFKYKDLEYRSKDGGFGYVIRRYDGDNENKPNKFNVGDFVTIIDDEDIPKNQIFVINRVPRRNDPKAYFENRYYLSTIIQGCRFEYYHEYNESKLKKYEGKVDSNSPLVLLQKFYRGEIEISKEILKKMERGEIILNTYPTFKEVEELKIK